MKTGVILISSFLIGVFGTIIGALLKIMHWQGADLWLIAGVITWAVFIIAAIYEVRTSATITRSEKMLWIVGFVLFGGITGIIYMLAGRKKIAGKVAVG